MPISNKEISRRKVKTGKRLVANPPCKLVDVVTFSPRCPFSRCKNCEECISNELDEECIKFLRDAESFGLA